MKLNLEQFEGHTPGEWTARSSSVFKDSSSCLIAMCDGLRGSEIEANTKLIAAAPALLAECKAQRERITELESIGNLAAAQAAVHDGLLREQAQREQIAELVGALKTIANSERLETGTFVCDFDTLVNVASHALSKVEK